LLALEAAAAREAKRRQASTDLVEFTEYTFARYQTAVLHRQIAEQLERVEAGTVDRLMLLVPCRHGKSELASRRFPAWYVGRHPERSFISASASASLAEEFGRDVRNLINSSDYQEIFPDVSLAEDSQARGHWQTAQGGSYFACGVMGALYGRGAHVLLIDDPFGSMSDARSEKTRNEIWHWFAGTAYNRLEKNGAIVIIAHRVHQDDLSGRLLAAQAAGGDRWEVVEMKAISESGEALWPEKYDLAALQRIKVASTAHHWSALYQQSPIVEEGGFFQEAWIKPIIWPNNRPPPFIRCYGSSDFAVTKGGGDYTVHTVIGIDPENRMHLVDLYRAQAAPRDSVEAMCDMIRKWKPAFWAHERVSLVSGLQPYIETRMRAREAWVQNELFVARFDKAVRSQSFRARMQLNGLYVQADAPWLADFKAEILAFPDGAHDDIVDALGLVGQLMDKWSPGVRPVKKISEWVDKQYACKDLDAMRPPSFMTL
jgi:predicted phage terminase large subunit-like protein